MLRDSTAVAVVVAVVVRTRPRAIQLAMVHMRKSIYGFPSVPLYGYGAPLGGLWPPELRYYFVRKTDVHGARALSRAFISFQAFTPKLHHLRCFTACLV